MIYYHWMILLLTSIFSTITYGQSTKKVCGQNGNTDTICSPSAGEIWTNGTWYPISWNPLYPTYVASPTIDIYIYFVQNYQNTLIKKWPNINTSKATFPVQVDDSWRLDPTNKTYDSMIYIVASGVDPEKEINSIFSDYPKPIHFNVKQVEIPPPVTTTSSSSVASITPTPTSQVSAPTSSPTHDSFNPPSILENSSKINDSYSQTRSVQPWIIAAIVLACLAVLCACLAIGWVTRQHKRRKVVSTEKGETPSSSMFPMNEEICREKLQTFSSGSIATYINSSHLSEPSPLKLYYASPNKSQQGTLKSQTVPNTPIKTTADHKMGFISTPSLPLEQVYGAQPCSTASFSNISSRSEPPLTSTDALLIADTFRQRMRCPEWQQKQQQTADGDEEAKRRQLSEDLLKKELEAEGTLMKKVGKRAHLLATTYQNE